MRASLFAVASLLVLSACSGGSDGSTSTTSNASSTTAAPSTTQAAAAPVQTAAQQAESIFATRCVLCHGTDGKGDGPGAASLNPKPRDYQDKEWQASVTDAEIEKTILRGGAAVGKSVLMPPNPDLESKPEVVAALRMKVRSFAGITSSPEPATAAATEPTASAPAAASAPAGTSAP